MSAQGTVKLRTRRYDLQLRNTFRIARGASDRRSNLLVEIEHEGGIGLGEAAPLPRYGQDWRSAGEAVEEMAALLDDARAYRNAVARVAVAGQQAAQAALDMALWDLAAQRAGQALWRFLGLDLESIPPTSFTIGLHDDPAALAERVREAADFEVLKVKLGGKDDRRALETVRSVTNQRLRVDANEGWSREQAEDSLEWLVSLDVELIEQPLPADDLEGHRRLREVSPLPIYADESVAVASDLPRLSESFDGINIKLMKCGGPGEALNMISTARAHGLGIMLGCMIESSLAITVAAHISPLVDFTDLDGSLLIANDPYVGAELVDGRMIPPDRPGLGVTPREVEPSHYQTTRPIDH